MTEFPPPGRVTVTGAAGYIGKHVVEAALNRGFDVVAVVRPGSASRVDPRATVVETDVLADDFDPAGLTGPDAAAFVHLAWRDGFVHDAPSHMLDLSAHFRLLDRVVAAGTPRLAVLGTMHEVGYWEGGIDADTPTSPRSLYGIAKDALRRASLHAFGDRTALSWLRCYYIYGDDRRNRSIFTRLLEADDRGDATLPFTTGRNLYDFIRVDRLAEQIVVAATTADRSAIVNCSTGRGVSLAEQAEAFIAEHGLSVRLEYGAFPDRPYDSPGVWGLAEDIERIMAADEWAHER